MAAGLLAQYLVIALAVLLSAAYVVRRQLPGPVRRLRIACAVLLVRDGRPAWMQGIGRWIAPAVATGGDACGTGCSGCGPSPGR